MTQEEKAKAYDEALKVLHKYDGANIMFTQSLKEEMFPELKEETEDEKIRQLLLRFVKYDMSYKTYRNKSKNRRDEMRAEFEADTGVSLKEREAERIQRHLNNIDFDDSWDPEYENAMELLASIGVPFSPDGTPLGIGWDD